VFRFIAFTWNEADFTQVETAHYLLHRLRHSPSQWKCALQCDGLAVFTADVGLGSSNVYTLSGTAGVVLGTLFTRGDLVRTKSSTAADYHFSVAQTSEILSTSGRFLLKAYWGRYCAFLRDPNSAIKWIVRDPTGHLPCMRSVYQKVRVYCSYMGDLRNLSVMQFSVNWDYVAARVVAPNIQNTETGLAEVSELQAGECDALRGDLRESSFYWHPYEFVENGSFSNFEETANLLNRTTKDCIHAWASLHPRIIHRLSGGLDSSIVLGCLRSAPTQPQVTCLTYYSDIGDSRSDRDERTYARLAAQYSGYPLVELPRSPRTRLDVMYQMGCFASPSIFFDRNVNVEEQERRIARKLEATAKFGGDGGDSLFYQSPLLATVGDYMRSRGICPSLFSVALKVAQNEGVSVWRILQGALRQCARRTSWSAFSEVREHRPFVNPAVLDMVLNDFRFLHPWFTTQDGIPHGKLWQAYNLSIPRGAYSNLEKPEDPDWAEPLISQPLVELCLRVPTYILTFRGKDRALARRAFAQEVPAKIRQRRAKGGLEGFIKETLMQNVGFVRNVLLDGLLVKERLLERRELERALSGRPQRISGSMTSVFDYLGMEIWLRGWVSKQQRAPPSDSGVLSTLNAEPQSSDSSMRHFNE
jgi:asparagine synthase (glutamine-hydrolysing)